MQIAYFFAPKMCIRDGAQILHSPAQRGLAGARALAETTAAEKGWYYMNWLANDDNPEYHRRVTGPAIVQAISREGRSLVDTITVGVGSAGTCLLYTSRCV